MISRHTLLMIGAAATLFLNATQVAVNAEISQPQLLVQAYQSLVAGENHLAIQTYSEALKNPELLPQARAAAFTNRALAAQRLKQHEVAIEGYTAALETGAMTTSEKAIALYNRGLSHHLLKQLPLAIEDYTNAVFFAPDMPQAFMSRGNALRESGQYLFALSDYERAIKYKHPDLARVHYASALTYMALRRLPDAQRELKKVLRNNPSHKAAQARLDELVAQAPAADVAVIEPASSGGAMGSTILNKPEGAPAVVPPDKLFEQQSGAATPADTKVPDRLPSASESPQIAAAPEPESRDATVAQPAPTAPEPVRIAAIPESDTSLQTASTSPAGDGSTAADLAPAAVVPQEANTGWTVQLGTAGSEDGARAAWAKMQKKHSVLRDVAPSFLRADLGTKGIVYRIRQFGFADAAQAKAACKQYKKSGADCFVSQSGT
jgi:tetratricopeptide (TPR) repeat protein